MNSPCSPAYIAQCVCVSPPQPIHMPVSDDQVTPTLPRVFLLREIFGQTPICQAALRNIVSVEPFY